MRYLYETYFRLCIVTVSSYVQKHDLPLLQSYNSSFLNWPKNVKKLPMEFFNLPTLTKMGSLELAIYKIPICQIN